MQKHNHESNHSDSEKELLDSNNLVAMDISKKMRKRHYPQLG